MEITYSLPEQLEELRNLKRWVCWIRDDVKGKVPVSPRRGYTCSVNAGGAGEWVDYDTAMAAAEAKGFSGVGFVLSGSEYSGYDLDHALDTRTMKWNPYSVEVVKTIDSYAERSVSGDGIHILVKGDLQEGVYKMKQGNVLNIEAYSFRCTRFLTVTGNVLYNRPIAERVTQAAEVYEKFIKRSAPIVTRTDTHNIAISGSTSDRILDAAVKFIKVEKLNGRREWCMFGAMLYLLGYDFDVFDEMSAEDKSRYKQEEMNTVWKSFSRWTNNNPARLIMAFAKEQGFNTADLFTDEERRQYGRAVNGRE